MRKLWLTLLLLVFSATPCLVLTGCGPSATERKESEQQEIEDDLQEAEAEQQQSEEEE